MHPAKTLSAVLLAAIIWTTGCSGPKQSGPVPQPQQPPPQAVQKPEPEPERLISIHAEPAEATLAPGATAEVQLTGRTQSGIRKLHTSSDKLMLTSSNPDIVKVTASGSSATGITVTTGTAAATGQKAKIIVETPNGLKTEIQISIVKPLQDTVTTKPEGRAVVTNAGELTVVVNKQRSLPDGYAPNDLIEPKIAFSFEGKDERRLMRKEAAEALEALFAKAKKDNIELYGVSGYRSYQTQVVVFNANVAAMGRTQAERYSARPGYSEHQTGLAMDVSSRSAKFELEEHFGDTAEGKWLAAHCAEFGFIIRYPKGKEEITGYAYEPWHLRYVGTTISKAVMSKGITLEEYFGDALPATKQQ